MEELVETERAVDTHLLFDWLVCSGLGNGSLSVALASRNLFLSLSLDEKRKQQTSNSCEQGAWAARGSNGRLTGNIPS